MNDERTKQNSDQYLEDLLNKGLAEYSAVEPRPGFESRILANLKDEHSSTTSPAWSFTSWLRPQMRLAGVMAVLVMAAGMSWMMIHGSNTVAPMKPVATTASNESGFTPPVVQTTPETKNIPNTSNPHSVITTAVQHPTQTRLAVVQEPVRLTTFPSPSPLTDQEKLMLAYLRQTNREELIAQSHIDPPLDIRSDGDPMPDKNRIPDESRQARPPSGIENVKN